MPYTIVVAGGSLYKLTTAGVATALTLPAGVTLSATRPPRFAVMGRNVCLVNNPNRSLFIDPDGAVRPMQLTAPVSPPILAAGAAGNLSGTFRAAYTHRVKDPKTGALLCESAMSPLSAAVTIASKLLAYSGVSICPDAEATHRMLYRTLTDGTTLFPWLELDGNVITLGADDLSDASLIDIAAPTDLGVGPGMKPGTFMTLCVEWKGRLWAVGDLDVDTLLYSGTNRFYGWPSDFGLTIAPIGADTFGITALLARRDELGVSRRGVFWKVVGGEPDEDGVPQFEAIRVKQGKGCWAPDSAVVIDDVAYFLGGDGVYTWGQDGFRCISDDKVRQWFATDTHFNRALFPNAFAKYNQTYHGYELHLAAAGSAVVDRWVFYDIANGRWYGPHQADVSTPTCAFEFVDSNNLAVPLIGMSNGKLYQQNQAGFSDAGTAIAVQLLSKWHDGNTPAIEKAFGGLTLVSKAISAIGHLLVKFHAGQRDCGITQTLQYDLRAGQETLGAAGQGPFLQVEITEDTDAIGCELHGYELPFFELGNRSRR